MDEPTSASVKNLARRYIDGDRFMSENDVLLFAMGMFGEFDKHYKEQLGQSLKDAFDEIARGESVTLSGQKEIAAFFDDLIAATRQKWQTRSP